MEDAAGFFANVFGGERFYDYVRPLVAPSIRSSFVTCLSRSAKFLL